jgi:hypothetical protein
VLDYGGGRFFGGVVDVRWMDVVGEPGPLLLWTFCGVFAAE